MRDALGLLTTFGRRGGALRAGALPWFPVVGIALGAVVGGVWWGAQQWWPAPLAAAIALAADLGCTGMLHVDGLADAADGLLPHANRERRLAVMRAPDVGAFGVATVVIVLLLQFAGLAARPASVLLLAGLWCAARALVAAVPAVVPYARAEGIATPLLDGARAWPALAIGPAVVLGGLGAGAGGAVAVVAAVVAGVAVIALAVRRVGGFTGDVLGAAVVVAEVAGIVVAAARW